MKLGCFEDNLQDASKKTFEHMFDAFDLVKECIESSRIAYLALVPSG